MCKFRKFHNCLNGKNDTFIQSLQSTIGFWGTLLSDKQILVSAELAVGECVLVCLRLHAGEWQTSGEGELLMMICRYKAAWNPLESIEIHCNALESIIRIIGIIGIHCIWQNVCQIPTSCCKLQAVEEPLEVRREKLWKMLAPMEGKAVANIQPTSNIQHGCSGRWNVETTLFYSIFEVQSENRVPPIPADSDNRCRQVTFAVYKNFDDINEEEIQVKNCLWFKHV